MGALVGWEEPVDRDRGAPHGWDLTAKMRGMQGIRAPVKMTYSKTGIWFWNKQGRTFRTKENLRTVFERVKIEGKIMQEGRSGKKGRRERSKEGRTGARRERKRKKKK